MKAQKDFHGPLHIDFIILIPRMHIHIFQLSYYYSLHYCCHYRPEQSNISSSMIHNISMSLTRNCSFEEPCVSLRK